VYYRGSVAHSDLATLAKSWREHVPYEVAVHFNANESYRRQYGPHVDSCALCQQLIDTIAPPDEVITTIMDSLEKAPLHAAIEELVRQLFGPGRHVNPVPTTAFVGRFDAPIPTWMLELLRDAEHSQNPLDHFGAVETYLRWHRPELAYGLLARGLERCGLDHKVAVRIGEAPRFDAQGADDLLELTREQQATGEGDPIRAVELSAKLGDHAAALRHVGEIVEVRGLKWRGSADVTSNSG
jgi:hypothetical protein